MMPRRTRDAHKGDAGRVLIIGGSRGMSGAVALASRASLQIGAGLCLAAVPDVILDTVAASVLEATTHPLACDDKGALMESAIEDLRAAWKGVQAVAIGPGTGRAASTWELVRQVVRECPVPLIIDADALHALRDIADEVKARDAGTVLTPHPGEMSVLLGKSVREIQDDRYGAVEECAQIYGATVVLKGACSLAARVDGAGIASTWVNSTGNPGMATGGSGDVLTGTIAGLLAQTKDALTPRCSACTFTVWQATSRSRSTATGLSRATSRRIWARLWPILKSRVKRKSTGGCANWAEAARTRGAPRASTCAWPLLSAGGFEDGGHGALRDVHAPVRSVLVDGSLVGFGALQVAGPHDDAAARVHLARHRDAFCSEWPKIAPSISMT
jgi:hydroxyethylthiazole kinase-like uncharacterized protein yjeF